MDFKNMTPIVVRSFHYDLNDEQKVKNEVNVSLRQVYQDLDDGSQESGRLYRYCPPRDQLHDRGRARCHS